MYINPIKNPVLAQQVLVMPLYSDRCYAVSTTKWQSYLHKFAPPARYIPGNRVYSRVKYSFGKIADIPRVAGVHFIPSSDPARPSQDGTNYYDKDKFELDNEGFVVPKNREKYVMTHCGVWELKESPTYVIDLPGGLNVSYAVYLRKQRGEPTPPRSPRQSPIWSESDDDAVAPPSPPPGEPDYDADSEEQPRPKRARTDNERV